MQTSKSTVVIGVLLAFVLGIVVGSHLPLGSENGASAIKAKLNQTILDTTYRTKTTDTTVNGGGNVNREYTECDLAAQACAAKCKTSGCVEACDFGHGICTGEVHF